MKKRTFVRNLNLMDITKIINNSLLNSISYKTYRNLIDKLAEEGKTSGPDQSEGLIEFTALNAQRYKRLDKTTKIADEQSEYIKNFDKQLTFLVITESWCGDAAQIVPVVNKIAELNPKINIKLVFRDENEPLMNQFLTNGGKAIPVVVILDSENNVITHWGSRPSTATKMVEDFKVAHGKLTPEFKEDLQKWYNQDKGKTTVDDFIAILKSI